MTEIISKPRDTLVFAAHRKVISEKPRWASLNTTSNALVGVEGTRALRNTFTARSGQLVNWTPLHAMTIFLKLKWTALIHTLETIDTDNPRAPTLSNARPILLHKIIKTTRGTQISLLQKSRSTSILFNYTEFIIQYQQFIIEASLAQCSFFLVIEILLVLFKRHTRRVKFNRHTRTNHQTTASEIIHKQIFITLYNTPFFLLIIAIRAFCQTLVFECSKIVWTLV